MLRLIALSRKSVGYFNTNCSVEDQMVLFAGSTPGMLSRHTIEGARRGRKPNERDVRKKRKQKQIGGASLTATNTSLLVFHAYVRAAHAR